MQAYPLNRNVILDHLSPSDLALLQPDLTSVELGVRRRLADPDVPIGHVYFLDSGIASLVTSVRHEPPIEIGVIGREGVVNLPVLMGTDRSPTSAFMQISGRGQCIPADQLRAAMALSPSLTRVLQQFAHVFLVQTASTVLANGRATIAERLARWLLMAHDRHDGDRLPLTHEFLSIMLGVRRSSVTVAIRDFERRRLVAHQRAHVVILDKQGLVALADGFYGTAEGELRRLFGPANGA